jgi:membrane protein GlpM
MMAHLPKCLLGALAVLLMALLSKTKSLFIPGLVPLFPTFALIAHYIVGTQRPAADPRTTALFGLWSLVAYAAYLPVVYRLSPHLTLPITPASATLAWAPPPQRACWPHGRGSILWLPEHGCCLARRPPTPLRRRRRLAFRAPRPAAHLGRPENIASHSRRFDMLATNACAQAHPDACRARVAAKFAACRHASSPDRGRHTFVQGGIGDRSPGAGLLRCHARRARRPLRASARGRGRQGRHRAR